MGYFPVIQSCAKENIISLAKPHLTIQALIQFKVLRYQQLGICIGSGSVEKNWGYLNHQVYCV